MKEKAEYPENLDQWIAHFVCGKLSQAENISLREWRDSSDEHEVLFQKLISEENFKREIVTLASWDEREAWKQVQQKSLRRKIIRRIFRVGSAAIALLVIGLGGLLWLNPEHQQVKIAQDITSQSGIRFSRSSGKVYRLDTLHTLALENMVIESDNRQMVVKIPSSVNAGVPEMNMIEVPAEAEYSLILADGTSVLLNAATTFRFPDNFLGQSAREVYLNGEAYFDVASDSVHPFVVHTDQAYVKVLGTSFNVKAYSGEELQQTTLVKGQVCMGENRTGKEVRLLPGMQASYHKMSGEVVKQEVDVSYYTAWKDGLFAFREQRLEEVMETLSRWYGFQYFFQNSAARDYIYTGKVPRHKELKEVLENFRLTEELDFQVSDNTIIIRTKN